MTNDRPVLDQLSLVVSNMTASVEFYRLLGLEVPENPPPWDDSHRSAVQPDGLSLDFDTVEFAQDWDRGWKGGPGAVIGFRLGSREAVDETYERLVGAGYRSQQKPWDAFWGARYAIVEDPDGRAVGLMGPVDPERRGPMGPAPE